MRPRIPGRFKCLLSYWRCEVTLHLYEYGVNQARKSLRLCLAGLRIGWFDPVAEASQLADDSRCALLPRWFGDRWAPFFVTSSMVQDQPDQDLVTKCSIFWATMVTSCLAQFGVRRVHPAPIQTLPRIRDVCRLCRLSARRQNKSQSLLVYPICRWWYC